MSEGMRLLDGQSILGDAVDFPFSVVSPTRRRRRKKAKLTVRKVRKKVRRIKRRLKRVVSRRSRRKSKTSRRSKRTSHTGKKRVSFIDKRTGKRVSFMARTKRLKK